MYVGKKHFGGVTVRLLSICVEYLSSLDKSASGSVTVSEVLFGSEVALMFTREILDLVQVID